MKNDFLNTYNELSKINVNNLNEDGFDWAEYRKQQIEKGTKLVCDSTHWKVYEVTTNEAARELGKNTNWEIADPRIYEGDDLRSNLWLYSFYICIAKTSSSDDYLDSFDKVLIKIRRDDGNSLSVYNANNRMWHTNNKKCTLADIPHATEIVIPGKLDLTKYENNIAYYSKDNPIPHNHSSFIHEIIIDSSVKSIPDVEFYNFKELVRITIPEGVTSIGESAFENCTNLIEVTIPSTVKVIRAEAFRNCTSLRSVKLLNGVTVIKKEAFFGCIDLKSIEIPNSVNTIGDYAFWSCECLEKVSLGSGLRNVGKGIFRYCYKLEDLVINDGIQIIGENMFENNRQLRSVKIPSSVKSIECYAFSGCKCLDNVELANGLESIEEYAFEGCEWLEEIIIPNSVESIKEDAFYGCDDLTIYCEATEQPDLWEDGWDSGCEVVWGVKHK